MADSSFDIVSKIDHMEVDNAFNQTDREIATRFDFKNTGAKIEKTSEKVNIEAESEERAAPSTLADFVVGGFWVILLGGERAVAFGRDVV